MSYQEWIDEQVRLEEITRREKIARRYASERTKQAGTVEPAKESLTLENEAAMPTSAQRGFQAGHEDQPSGQPSG
jgi:hypothetical protein